MRPFWSVCCRLSFISRRRLSSSVTSFRYGLVGIDSHDDDDAGTTKFKSVVVVVDAGCN